MQTDNDILNFADSIMSDKPIQEPAPTNEVVVETPAVETAPVVEAKPTEVQTNEAIEFVVAETQNLQVEQKPTESVNDFEAMFQERLTKEFGLDFPTLQTKLAQFNDLQAKAEANVYKSEQGKIFDDLVSKGVPIETITSVAFKDLSGADDLQVLDYQMQLKYPNSTKEQREAYLQETYKQTEDALEREKLAGGFKMQQDAEQARKELDALKATALQSPSERQNAIFELKEKERVSVWENNLTNKVINDLSNLEKKVKLNISFDGKPNEQEVAIKIPIPQNDKAEMAEFLKVNIPHWKEASTDGNGQAFVKEVLQNRFIVQNIDKIMQGVANSALSYAVENQAKYLHNYQAPKHQSVQTTAQTTSTDSQTLAYGESLFS